MSDSSLAALEGLTERRGFTKGAHLLRGGDRAVWVFFLTRGLVRESYLDSDGTTHTRRFVAENDLTGSLLDLLSGAPSVTWIEALEPCEVLAFRYAEFNALAARLPDVTVLARRHAEALFLVKARREYEMLALGASDRYQAWRRENPALDARVTRQHLASYLGVTPEHLSRLRALAVRKPAPPARAPRRST